MESHTVDDLCINFKQKLQTLDTILTLKDAHEDETSAIQMQELETKVDEVKMMIALQRNQNNEQKVAIAGMQAICKDLASLKVKLTHMLNNLPARLPKPAQPERNPPKAVVSTSSSATSAGSQSRPAPVAAKPQQQQQHHVYIPEMDFLTVEEFNQVPKYLKGRLTYDQVNKFVEGMNAAFIAKYELLAMKRSKMSDSNRKRWEKYSQQVNKDTKGCHFIVDEDLKEHGHLKMDAVARSVMGVLRHCGRLREVHGGGLKRYVYLEHY